jgi:hypothetical protein
MNLLHDVCVIAFKISVCALSSSLLYKLFKQYVLPVIKNRALDEIEQKKTLKADYEKLIQERLMAETQLSLQQQDLIKLSQKITEWRQRAAKKQEALQQEALSCHEKYTQKRQTQTRRIIDAQMRKNLIKAAIEKSTEDLATHYQDPRSFAHLITGLTRE